MKNKQTLPEVEKPKRHRRTKEEMRNARFGIETIEGEQEPEVEKQYYCTVIFKPGKSMLDIGEIIPGKTDDGWTKYNYVYIDLGNDIHLAEINGKYYIDQPHQIRRLDKELIDKYKLNKYLIVKE